MPWSDVPGPLDHRDWTHCQVWSSSIRRFWSCWRHSRTFLDMIGRYFLVHLVVLPSCPVTLRTLPCWWTVSPVHPIIASVTAVAWATNEHVLCFVATSGRLCRAPSSFVSSWSLHSAWFPSSCLNFAWYLGSSMHLHMSFLRCWSSDHHVVFVQVTFCILLNYKTITCKSISPI